MSKEAIRVIGNVGSNVDFKPSRDGKSHYAAFSVAAKRKNETRWYQCYAWDQLGSNVNKYVNPGDMILVRGLPDANVYNSKEGPKAQIVIKVLEFDVLYSKKRTEGSYKKEEPKKIEDPKKVEAKSSKGEPDKDKKQSLKDFVQS